MKAANVGYTRYSSDGQKLGNSEARQDEGFAMFCSAHPENFIWPDSYCDRGKSGYKAEHLTADFGRLLADCKAHKFPANSIIYFEDMDRFGRMKQHKTMSLWHEIMDCGYRIGVSGVVYSAASSEMELLVPIIKAILAYEESRKKAERLSKAWQSKRKAANGLTKYGVKSHACPHWIIADGAEYKIDTAKQQTLKTIAVLIKSRGMGQISAELGLGADWKGLQSQLRSRTLLGEYQPMRRTGKNSRESAGDAIHGYYPAALTEDEFYTIQHSLDSRKTVQGRRGEMVSCLFTGLIHDATDGAAMVMRVQSRGARILINKVPKGAKYVHYNLVEKALLAMLHEIKPSSLRTVSADASLTHLEGLAAKYKTRAGEIKKELAFSDKSASELRESLNMVTAALDEVTGKIEEHKREQMKQTNSAALDEVQSLLRLPHDLETRTRLKSAIRNVVTRIDVAVRDSKSAAFKVQLANGQVKAFAARMVDECLHVSSADEADLNAALKNDGRAAI